MSSLVSQDELAELRGGAHASALGFGGGGGGGGGVRLGTRQYAVNSDGIGAVAGERRNCGWTES